MASLLSFSEEPLERAAKNRVAAMLQRLCRTVGSRGTFDLRAGGPIKAAHTASDGQLCIDPCGARVADGSTDESRLRTAWAAVVDAVGPAHDWPPHELEKALMGSAGSRGGHLFYLKRSGRFSLTTFLVLNGASPEVVYEFYAAARLLVNVGSDGVFKRWSGVASTIVGIAEQQRGAVPAKSYACDTRLGNARVRVDGEYAGQEPWLGMHEREIYDTVGTEVVGDMHGNSFEETLAAWRAKRVAV